MFQRTDIPKLKKDLTLTACLLENELTFKTRWGVFSPKAIDDGTLLLMKYISAESSDICLDLGCGYGPIGLALAKHCPQGEVHMVDKDFVAVELSNINATLNNLPNVKAYLSDAFAQCEQLVHKFHNHTKMCLMKYDDKDLIDLFLLHSKIIFLQIKFLRSKI